MTTIITIVLFLIFSPLICALLFAFGAYTFFGILLLLQRMGMVDR